jgi:hypothetical protein
MNSTLVHKIVPYKIKYLSQVKREDMKSVNSCSQGHFLLCLFDCVLIFSIASYIFSKKYGKLHRKYLYL